MHGRFAHCAFDLFMAFVANEDDGLAFAVETYSFEVNFRHQRTGGVNDVEIFALRRLMHLRGNAVGTEDTNITVGNLVEAVNKDDAPLAQVLDYVLIVYNLVEYVDGFGEKIERPFNNINGSHHTRAKTARFRQHHSLYHYQNPLNC